MNLTKNELTAFLGILLDKNPIIDIQIDSEAIRVKHSNGLENILEIDKPAELVYPSTVVDDDTDYTSLADYYEIEEEVKPDLIPEIREQISSIENKLSEYINAPVPVRIEYEKPELPDFGKLISDLLEDKFQVKEANVDIDLEKLNNSLLDQVHSISETIVSKKLEEYTANLPVIEPIPDVVSMMSEFYISMKKELVELVENIPAPVTVEYDATDLKEELEALILSSIPTSIPKEELKETVLPVNYSYLENFISTKIEELSKSIEHVQTKSVSGIENRRNRIILSYTDNTIADITDIIIPIVKLHMQPARMPMSGGMAGAGGGSKGDPGLSAYDIARANGFIGTELEWLNSLSGGSSVPLPGSIEYDANNVILSVTKGTSTTFINRNPAGDIINIESGSYRTVFQRDVDGKIIGWSVETL